jgi:tripartite ATP-independent transporter DctM subunit
VLIPPSVILVVYGIITETSIGKLFLAGFIPGIIQALMYMTTINLLVRITPDLGPRGPETTLKEKVKSLSATWDIVLLFILVIGGIYTGWFTPSEAAGIGAFGALLSLIIRRQLTWVNLKKAAGDTSRTAGMVFWILLGAMFFGYFLTVGQVPSALTDWVASLSPNRYIILALVLILLVVLGALMDEMAIILLTLPILYPLISKLNFDPVWFGIIMTKMMEIGMIAPPVGINVFVIAGISDIPMWTIYRGVIPFLIADMVEVVLLILSPEIALFLPSLMK